MIITVVATKYLRQMGPWLSRSSFFSLFFEQVEIFTDQPKFLNGL